MTNSVNVAKLAKLTNIPISDEEIALFSTQFSQTLTTVATLQELDTASIEATPQVTNLTNVFREDQLDLNRMFSQAEALANAKQTERGYFVVPGVLHEA